MMDADNSLVLRIAFSMAKGVAGEAADELMSRIGSPEAFFSSSRRELIARAGADFPIFEDAYRKDLLRKAAIEATFVKHNKIDALMRGDSRYPSRLMSCSDAPFLLYKFGRCDLNFKHSIGIVGTRHATYYGSDFTGRLVADLAKAIPGVAIISGLAYGIDICAHKAALDAGLPTVAVMAHGLNTVYPAEHRSYAARIVKEGGALATEYPSSARMHRSNFLARNRIVAGLCDCLVVIESDIRGGSMSTARIASLYNRDVFALPGRISDVYSHGTNKLIANHTAQLITCASDILDAMGWKAEKQAAPAPPALFPALPPDLQQIYDFIKENPDSTVNDMCVGLGLSYSAVTDRLFRLEFEDMIISIPGGRFAPASCQ